MRIGILANGLSRGGAERQAAQWAAVVAQWPDAELSILAVDPADRLYALPDGVPVTQVGKRHGADLARVFRAIRRFVRDLDLAICFQPYPAIFCIGSSTPVLLVTGDDPRYHWDDSGVPNRVIDAAFRNAAAACAPDPQLVDCYRDRGVRARGPWLCIPNIVDDAGFIPSAPEKHGALFVGRLEEQKDPLLAVDACAAAGVALTVLGEGSLHDAIAERGAGSDVTLHPFTSRPWELYARHRALLLSSRYEPFGNVIVESLAAGTPVVSVDCDFGPRSVLADAGFSTVVPGRDPVELGLALRTVVDRPYSEAEAEECARIAARYRPSALDPLIRDAVERTIAGARRGR
ncbi:glycosyltransferase [Conexibacter woesei]|uniref:Glycosyl transferase group 1 n=1 Tax=Conexibacter woesei (strain DSM 14684 / CCUG 47730 / CIP 108061 / JCM 11494 / NBRC 100937 / ID131577) TaxID=469383 RepID=D3FFB9_CONWI|nr:glycosyltransferase [Conexibacter woesei]ADB53712.1 glycosyl transferase group 1 [Conexibacter woesei DSM 14684]